MLLGIAGLSANATIVATTNSLPFSIGYGATSQSTAPFTTTETSAFNTPTTQGAFTFTPTVTGNWFASAGMRFTGRVMTNGDVSVGISADSGHFLLSITSTYTGSVPAGLTPIISLNLSELRIRGIADATNFYPGADLKWTETTGGVTNSSPAVTLNVVPAGFSPAPSHFYTNANNWVTLSWNPGEIYTTNAFSQTRTFLLTTAIPGAGGYSRAIEGLELFGTVDVFFMIPEPSTALLLGSGLTVVWWARRRRITRS